MEENLKPLDVTKLKNLVQQESVRMNLRSLSGEGESSFTLALALSAAIKKIFFEKSETTFSGEPALEKKPITQFVHKMRVDAMEKFNSTTVFSVLHFAPDEEAIQRQEFVLTLVVYLEQKFLPEFLRLLKYPYIDSDNEAECKDGCGTLANLIAGQYKREMSHLGYKDLMMSTFESFINTTSDGVEIPKGLTEKYELSFDVEDAKCLVVEMVTLDMLPKWKGKEISAPKKILIIDDDLAFIKNIASFLQSEGYELIIAHDGEEGIKKMKGKPDLIILDLAMPFMDGYEFATEKRKMEGAKQVPLIILTAKEGLADINKVDGASEYFLKPFQPGSLLKSIQRYT